MVQWPAVIKLKGDDELMFVASQQAWDNSDEMQQTFFTDDDCLIDSQGAVFGFVRGSDQLVTLQKTSQLFSKDELVLLVRSHMSLIKACCVSKFYADSIAEAIFAVQQIQGRIKSSPKL